VLKAISASGTNGGAGATKRRCKVLNIGKRLAVFSIREAKGGSIWVRAGTAFVNKDGSLNLLLDVLPLDGKLHVREAGEKRDGVTSVASAAPLLAEVPMEPAVAAAGGH
jgi:hypothetical protein